MHYLSLETKLGWLAAAWDQQQVKALVLPRPTRPKALDELQQLVEGPLWQGEFPDLKRQLQLYFQGRLREFRLQLDKSWATPFQRQVYQFVERIPYGEVRSYGEIAAMLGNKKAARAVGQAVGKNRIPLIIPCHRVLRSDGSLGGFSGGEGLKESLLRHETEVDSGDARGKI